MAVSIISRASWGAAAPTKAYSTRGQNGNIVVHHTADELGFSFRRKYGRPGPKYWGAAYRTNKRVQAAIKLYEKDDARLYAAEAQAMRAMQAYHQRLGWADLGYHFVIFPSGHIYGGRPAFARGAHTLNNNEKLGISFAGNFEKEQLTPQAIKAYNELIAHLANSYGKGTIAGHYKYNPTACPGRNIKNRLGV